MTRVWTFVDALRGPFPENRLTAAALTEGADAVAPVG